MRFKKIRILVLFTYIFLIVACSNNKNLNLPNPSNQLSENKNLNNELENNITNQIKENTCYKIYYGKWKYSKVVSQHLRLGGDLGYEDLIGDILIYHPDYFDNGNIIYNPTYLISIYPTSNSKFFFPEQMPLNELMPNSDFLVFVDVLHDRNNASEKSRGYNLILKDDETMYVFENNCIYELQRESYIDDYNPIGEYTFQER